MKKRFFPVSAFILILLLLLAGCGRANETGGIIFKTEHRGDHLAMLYDGREYVPYCVVSNSSRGAYLGHEEGEPDHKIYEYKGYSSDAWIISYLDSGLMDNSMLMREIHVTDIPDGLSSEYEWNN